MLHQLIFGLLLGLGAAIPFGPINFEMVRRNLTLGYRFGLAFGFGACATDISYILFFSLSALTFLTNTWVLKAIGFFGSLILAWFGFKSLCKKARLESGSNSTPPPVTSLLKDFSQGYILTLLNPLTILFWSSISATLALHTRAEQQGLVMSALGVLLGTSSWVLVLNGILHITKNYLSTSFMKALNYLGGSILLVFAAIGIYHVFF